MELTRRKGSNGNVTVLWAVNIQSGNPDSVQINPMVGETEFTESQWNSSFTIEIFLLSEDTNGLIVNVSLVNVTGGARLGSFTNVKITNFPKYSDPEPSRNPVADIRYIIITVAALFVTLPVVVLIIVWCCKRSVIITQNSDKAFIGLYN